jgi:hypothetical protein
MGECDHDSGLSLGFVVFGIFGSKHARLEQGERRARRRRTERAVLCRIQAVASDAIRIVDRASCLDSLFR